MSDPSTAVTQAKANSTVGTFERKGVFPFLSLPQELRQMVYKLALVSECVQPGIPDSSHKRRYPESYIDYESISAVTLLCTSKQVYYEANIFLYSHNMFTTLYRPSAQQIHDILELLADERGLPKRGWSSDWVARQWTACHDIVAQAVSTIPDPDTSKLAVWLFGDFAPGAVSRWDEWDPWALKPVLGDDPYGFYLVAFLRQIGPSNAAKIQSVELTLDSLPNAANILPLFTEILRQHVKGLQELVIDFDCINDYGSTMEFDERNEYQAIHAIAFFSELRTLVKQLPHLQEIEMFSCADEMRAMANAVLNEKRTGVTVDLEKKWATLFEEAAVRLLAIPEISNGSCIGYRAEEYIYLPNWQRSDRND